MEPVSRVVAEANCQANQILVIIIEGGEIDEPLNGGLKPLI